MTDVVIPAKSVKDHILDDIKATAKAQLQADSARSQFGKGRQPTSQEVADGIQSNLRIQLLTDALRAELAREIAAELEALK